MRLRLSRIRSRTMQIGAQVSEFRIELKIYFVKWSLLIFGNRDKFRSKNKKSKFNLIIKEGTSGIIWEILRKLNFPKRTFVNCFWFTYFLHIPWITYLCNVNCNLSLSVWETQKIIEDYSNYNRAVFIGDVNVLVLKLFRFHIADIFKTVIVHDISPGTSGILSANLCATYATAEENIYARKLPRSYAESRSTDEDPYVSAECALSYVLLSSPRALSNLKSGKEEPERLRCSTAISERTQSGVLIKKKVSLLTWKNRRFRKYLNAWGKRREREEKRGREKNRQTDWQQTDRHHDLHRDRRKYTDTSRSCDRLVPVTSEHLHTRLLSRISRVDGSRLIVVIENSDVYAHSAAPSHADLAGLPFYSISRGSNFHKGPSLARKPVS